MKLKYIIMAMACLSSSATFAQSLHSEDQSKLSDGILNINLGSNDNQLRIGGFVSADGHYTDNKNANNDKSFDVDQAMLSVEGSFLHDKLGFFLQADFTLSYPLLDAYVTYKPAKGLVLTAGQKQTFTNSRDMMLRDQATAMGGSHSLMSRTFDDTGRELGIFAEYRIPTNVVGLDLGAAVTSGDGRNSFGSSSTDTDNGGLKYGGRATFYPLGYFKNGNELVFHDFLREEKPKVALGVAFSYNDGASNSVGEGHGDFTLYNIADGTPKYPDYRKWAADLMMKWQGFTLLFDWQNTSATSLNTLATSDKGDSKLKPEQIADYLVIGNGFDVQAGYLFKSLWAIEAAWNYAKPEFHDTESAALHKMNGVEVGVSKYFKNNTIRLQLQGSYVKYDSDVLANYRNTSVRLNAQVMF